MDQTVETRNFNAQRITCLCVRPLSILPFATTSGAVQIVTELREADISHIVHDGQDTLPTSLRRAVDRRKAEYLVARACASELLHTLGAQCREVGFGKNREPLWPVGFVGSITHSGPFVAVAVAPDYRVASIGIDAESIVDEEGAKYITSACLCDKEIQLIDTDNHLSRTELTTLIFSAKEAFFKVLYPFVKKYFDFLDAQISNINIDERSLYITLNKSISDRFHEGFSLKGTYSFLRGHVFTIFEFDMRKASSMIAAVKTA